MYHLAVSEFHWRDFPENLCLGHNENSEYRKWSMLILLYDYNDVTQFDNYILCFLYVTF